MWVKNQLQVKSKIEVQTEFLTTHVHSKSESEFKTQNKFHNTLDLICLTLRGRAREEQVSKTSQFK